MRARWTAFWTATWFTLTQIFTRFGGHVIERALLPSDIAERLSYGRKYRYDRNAGAMTHPRKVQARVDKGLLIGDCEDHAGYWCATLLASDLVEEAYLACAFYTRDGKKRGHAVCVFKQEGYWFWCDYNTPYSLVERDEWVQSVLARYEGTFRFGFMHRVTLTRGERLRFGKVITYPQKKK